MFQVYVVTYILINKKILSQRSVAGIAALLYSLYVIQNEI